MFAHVLETKLDAVTPILGSYSIHTSFEILFASF